MTFKIIVQQMPVGVEFEVGSLSEAAAILEQEDSQIRKIGAIAKSLNEDGAGEAPTPAAEAAAEKPKRGRPAKPPVEAVAPDPILVPSAPVVAAPPIAPVAPAAPAAPVAPAAPAAPAAPPPPGFEIPADGGIPPALVRTPAPPLPAPVSPPPVGVLGPKVVKALDALKEGKPDGGQALADWLAAAGLTIKGKTYDEATRALLMISDEKITAAGVLEPLGVQ